MKAGTSIIYRIENKGPQQHGKFALEFLENGSTKYLIDRGANGYEVIQPRWIDVIEPEHGTN